MREEEEYGGFTMRYLTLQGVVQILVACLDDYHFGIQRLLILDYCKR